jgi:putative membrane protein
MGRLIAIVLVNAIALIAIILVVPGITWPGALEARAEALQVLAVAVMLGVVNTFVKPIVMLLALPIRLATLGLVGFVINVAALLAVAWLAGQLGFGFQINGFPPDLSIQAVLTAALASVVMAIVSAVASLALQR